MENDEQTKLFTVDDLMAFAEWFNIKQWQGGKGDPQKIMFCKNDYVGIVKLFLKQKNKP